MDSKLLVLYATQTGNAEDVAMRVAKVCLARGVSEIRLDMADSYFLDVQDNKKPLFDGFRNIVFVCSTTGRGEMPDTMRLTWRYLLQRNLPSTLLQEICVSVVGLGDSSYAEFNYAARKLHRRFLQLGATELTPRFEFDEQHPCGVDGFFPEYLDSLLSATNLMQNSYEKEIPLYKLEPVSIAPHPARFQEDKCSDFFANEDCVVATVISNKRVTHPDHFQETKEILLELPKSKDLETTLQQPGSALHVYVKTSDDVISSVLESTGWSKLADQFFELRSSYPETRCKLPKTPPFFRGAPNVDLWAAVKQKENKAKVIQFTLRSLLQWALSPASVPRAATYNCLAKIWQNIDQELVAPRLAELSTSASERYEYADMPRRSAAEVLADFSLSSHEGVNLDPSAALELFPSARPRAYSVASVSKSRNSADKFFVSLLYGVVEYRTSLSTPRIGICTGFMRNLNETDNSSMIVQPISTKLTSPPLQAHSATIIVATGTGLAPARHLVQHLSQTQRKLNDTPSPLLIFLGVRGPSLDFYFSDFWNSIEEKGSVLLETAFSRAASLPEKKSYVQSLIINRNQEVTKAIYDHSAHIYIFGGTAGMPDAVLDALAEAAVTAKRASTVQEAERHLQTMRKSGKIQFETWT